MRFVRIFFKNIIKYFRGFIAIFLCGLLSVAVMELKVERLMVEKETDACRMGFQHIDAGIQRMDMICRMLYQNDNFDKLSKLQGKSTGQEVVNLSEMKEELIEIDLLADEFAYVFCLFPDNSLFLSSGQCSLNLEDYYGEFLEVVLDGRSIKSGEELKDALVEKYMSEQYFVRLDHIKYAEGVGMTDKEDAVLYLSYDNAYTISEPRYLVCFVLDYNWLVDNILANNLRGEEKGFCTVKDEKNGKELLNFGMVPDRVEELHDKIVYVGKQQYYLIEETIEELGWSAKIGISMSEIQEIVSPSRVFLSAYVVIGLLIVLVLTSYYSMKRYFGFKNTMALFPEHISGLLDGARDEYELLGNRVVKLLESGEDDRKIIAELKLQNEAVMLEHLIVNGIKSDKERGVCEKYFEQEPEFFCVVLAELGTDDIPMQEELVLGMVNYLDAQGITLLAQVHTGVCGEIFLIEVAAHQEANVSSMKAVFKEISADITEKYNISMHVGISTVGTGFDNIHRCYKQASQLVNAQNIYEGETIVEVYDIFTNTLYENPVDLEFLNRLHNMLLCGQKEGIDKAFEKIEGYYTRMPYQYEKQKKQIFYAVLNVFHMAALELDYKETGSEIRLGSEKSCRQMMADFENMAEILCNHVMGKKRSRNEELKEMILEYLHQNYNNSELSAGMVCQEIGIAEKYLFQFLKEQTGETFATLLLHLRIECAKEYLRKTDYSNEQIAFMSGFSSVNTFYRNFKKVVGVTPNIYKENSK